MRRSLITLIFLAFVLIAGYSQNGLELGTMVRQTMKEAWADVEPIGQDGKGVYYLLIPYSEVMTGMVVGDADFYFALVNEHGEKVMLKQVNFAIDGRDAKYEFTHQLNGKIVVFTSVQDKKDKSVTFYKQELDKASLTLSSPSKLVQLSFAKVKKDYDRASFKSELSRDKSKLLISYSLVDKSSTILSFGYVLLDANLKELYTWDGALDMSDGIYLFEQFRVSNKGEVYLSTRFFDNKKDYSKNTTLKKSNFISTTRSTEYKANYDYRIVKFDKSGSTKIVPLDPGKTFYNSLDLEIDAEGNLILIGFYADNEENLPTGAVCLKVNTKTNAVTEIDKKSFGTDFIMPSNIEIKNNGLAGKDQYLHYRFIYGNIQFNKNGGYTLVGERYLMQSKRNGNVFYTVHHMDDLAVVDVDAKGVIKGIYKIEKSQQIEDLEMFNASFFYTELNGIRYFVFANMGKPSVRETQLVKLTSDGKQTREVLFTTKDAEVTVRPKDCFLFGTNKLLMYTSKNNRYVRWVSKKL